MPPVAAAPAAGTDHDALPPGTRFGEFEIIRVLGVGGFGIVYLAKDHSLDQAPEDNRASAFVRVKGEAVALVLDREPALGEPIASALRLAGFQTSVKGLAGTPLDVAGFAAYDLVVLSDITAGELSGAQLEAIASYSRDLGGGLLLMGGEHSFGPGGYGRTPVEEVSPVSFDLKQDRRRASLAEAKSLLSRSVASLCAR